MDMGASITMAKGAADAGLFPSIAVIVGASSVEQLGDSLKTLNHLSFEEEELHAIAKILM